MSYDIDLRDPRRFEHDKTCTWELQLGPEHYCPGHVVEIWSGLTYNLSPMMREAGCFIKDFDKARCASASPQLALYLDRMKAEPERYRALNPPNGWGTYEGAIEFLERFVGRCRVYPEYVIRVQ